MEKNNSPKLLSYNLHFFGLVLAVFLRDYTCMVYNPGIHRNLKDSDHTVVQNIWIYKDIVLIFHCIVECLTIPLHCIHTVDSQDIRKIQRHTDCTWDQHNLVYNDTPLLKAHIVMILNQQKNSYILKYIKLENNLNVMKIQDT